MVVTISNSTLTAQPGTGGSAGSGSGTTSGTGTETDAGDVRRAAAGDLAAFERLYHRHGARIHTLARRMLGAAEADEATQDAFVRAWEKLGTFRGEAAFSTWLHRLAVHLFLGRRSRAARHRDRFLEDDGAIAATTARPAHPELRLDLERPSTNSPRGRGRYSPSTTSRVTGTKRSRTCSEFRWEHRSRNCTARECCCAHT